MFRGDFTVIGGAKSAAVPHPDGSHRRLYALESPESWFEDFGEAHLVDGKAQIKLDPDFAKLVKTDKYHVFLTSYADSTDYMWPIGLTKASRSGSSKGEGKLSFSYRVVAKRKDIPGERLAKVTLPTVPPELARKPNVT